MVELDCDELEADVAPTLQDRLAQLPPKLRRRAVKADLLAADVLKSAEEKLREHDVRAARLTARVFKSAGRLQLQDLLQEGSRLQALQGLHVEAGLSKPGAKKKKVNHTKNSILKKKSKKLQDKLKKAEAKQNLKTLKVKKKGKENTDAGTTPAEGHLPPPPLPPPADVPETEEPAAQPLADPELAALPAVWLVAKERAGREYWGTKGQLVSADQTAGTAKLSLDLVPGTREFHLQYLKPVPAAGFAQHRKLDALTKLTRPLKRCFLQEAGQTELEGDNVEVPAASGRDLAETHLHWGWSFLAWSLQLNLALCCMLPPGLLVSWLSGMHPEGDVAAVVEGQVARQIAVDKCLQVPLVFVPVQAGGHWTLLVLQKNENWICRYYDSLTVESDICRARAAETLKCINVNLQLPARENAAYQVQGSNTCGCFVLHWMEAEVREHVLLESPCSAGWPEAKQWAIRLQRLGGILQKEREKLAEEEKAAAVIQQRISELRADAAEKKMAAVHQLEDLLKKLAKEAQIPGTKQPEGKACFGNLFANVKEQLEKIKNHGIGLCGRCRWTTGCLSCDYEKALQYYLKKEFPMDE